MLSVATVLFLWVQQPEPVHLLTLMAFVLSGNVAGRLIALRPSSALLALYLAGLTAAFVVLKGYQFLRIFPGDTLASMALDLVGLSFVFFRQIHYVVDVRQGEIRDLDLWTYLVYQLNPFTLLAGPIQRYQDFHEDWQSLKPLPQDDHELRQAFLRILLGVVKVAFIGDYCYWAFTHVPPEWGAAGGVLQFYLFPAYVYFNFVGYCDIVIAGAALAGLRVPENFDRPYLARNMIDYWTRWHRSLSFWIRSTGTPILRMACAVPPVAMIVKPRSCNEAASWVAVGLSPSVTLMKTVPADGRMAPAAAWALPNAVG